MILSLCFLDYFVSTRVSQYIIFQFRYCWNVAFLIKWAFFNQIKTKFFNETFDLAFTDPTFLKFLAKL